MKTASQPKARGTREKPGLSSRTSAVRQRESAELALRRIVVPTDFSAESRKALVYAQALAVKFEATLEILYVVEPASFFTGVDQSLVTVSNEQAAEAAHEKLVKIARRMVDDQIPVFPKVRIGKAYMEICALAREHNADLIVISTHGHTGIKHTVLGSVAERVVRHAPCPVLVVRQNEREFVNLGKERQ